MPARHVAQASPEVGGEGSFIVFSHSGLQSDRVAWTRPSNQRQQTEGIQPSESQLAVEKRLSASGGAGVEDSGATPLTIYIYIYG